MKTWEAEAANAVDDQTLADLSEKAESNKALLDQLKFGLSKSTRGAQGLRSRSADKHPLYGN
eukprot:6761910-Alexandrium_andersonii.AAC.1